LEKIKTELMSRRNKPTEVYFSPSSDIFQPVPEVFEIAHSVLEYLLFHGVGIAFLTKGRIPEKTVKLLIDNADKIRAQIGIITPFENIRGMFEPNAAPVETRLRQIEEMIGGGIAVEARIMPILPGITDSPESIETLFKAVARTHVKKVAISALFLRPAIMESIMRLVPDKIMVKNLLQQYVGAARLGVHAKNSSVVPLPREKREDMYSNYKSATERYGLEMSICGCMNPDIGGSCDIGSGATVKPAVQYCLF
jgi:DNA repair photolyase